MSEKSHQRALQFMNEEKQFHLGFLPTEQSNPLTKNLDKEFQKSTTDGVRCLQRVDRNVLEMCKRIFASEQYASLCKSMEAVIARGGKIVFSGCGATGRLSILLECMWRNACADIPGASQYANHVFSIMTGGDYALVKSVESFEDYQEFGRQQVRELNMDQNDMLVAITEGGETSSVLGTVDEACRRNAAVYLLFNNPADLLAERLERSRDAIRNPKVTVLDLFCGPMGLAGSTRMQATTSEQLVAGAALETLLCHLLQKPVPAYATEFETLLGELEAGAPAIAKFIDFEAGVYRKKGKVTYFADRFMLDIFTDTTERSPTFMLPPFRKKDDAVSPKPWAFVKDPTRTTEQVWEYNMRRPLRCLEWTPADYDRMKVPTFIRDNPPQIRASELLKFEVGCERPEDRCDNPLDAAVLVSVGAPSAALQQGVAKVAAAFQVKRSLVVGNAGTPADFLVPTTCKDAPLQLMNHMAIKLVLNTASTGIMVSLGRVTGNWMSWVAISNKKLIDRAIRLICEIGEVTYLDAADRLFAAEELLGANYRPQDEQESFVQYVLRQIREEKQKA